MTEAFINRIATAVPPHDVHGTFLQFGRDMLQGDNRRLALFDRMAERSGIAHRYSFLEPGADGAAVDAQGFYRSGAFPGTAARMRKYEDCAPGLAVAAVEKLLRDEDRTRITHVIVTSCTGFAAPGLDLEVVERCRLKPTVERTLIGFMGCYAAVAALRAARHIVRSERDARVLVVAVELSSLHLQDEHEIERLLMMLQFGDGAAAALVTGGGEGFQIERPFAAQIADSAELIRWAIGDTGFLMHLSGEVPGRIQAALRDKGLRERLFGDRQPAAIANWAVHAGGRSILDAVENGLDLPGTALAASREVLARLGNMSSPTLMFVLAELLARPVAEDGVALAFGPGLAAEGFHLRRA